MKNLFRKILVAVCTVSAAVTLAAASITVSATDGTRSMDQAGQAPAVSDNVSASSGTESSATVNQSDTGVRSSAGSNAAPAPAANSAVNNVTTTNTKPQKTASGWSNFWWFLLSVAVNFILSCWIGNRFYRLARKSAQGSAEIRALRKDIEEKFAGTLKDIDEPAAEIVNRNESYARTDDGIELPPRKSRVELSEEEMERIARWDAQRVHEPDDSAETEDDYEDDMMPERKPVRRSYQPTRKSLGIGYSDEDNDEQPDAHDDRRREQRRPARRSAQRSAKAPSSTAKNKARDFLSNIFPFDE